ncbi:pre-toxin TG domain-containing protein [Metabacillus sp. 84]|uniref:pre-toxin TG domain-containing protein n=1 Tax=Metabacillus sp. 84 TaxID=3404705 RepID=UPI003CF910DF
MLFCLYYFSLEEQLDSGSKKSKDLVAAQQEDIAKILEGIQDLVPLTAFSTETFDEKMKKADEKRAETVEAVNTLDDQVMAPAYLDGVTKAMMTIQIGYGAIIEATVQGGTAQPMNFSVEAYKKHDVHDARERMDEYINAFQYREKKADEVRAEIAAEKARIAEEQARIEAEKNKPWYEKAWEGTKVFAGEVSGYNDTVRATTGVDPVTGRKLSEAERVAAGAMAAAGFIPVVGWAGRAIKGGAAIVKTAKTMNAATHSLDAYKTTKGMEILSKTEKGIYGLYTGNSAWEFGTGTDMFGNKLTEEQRMNALWGGLTMGAAGGAAHFIDKGGLRKLADKAPYSTAYAKDYVAKAQNNMIQIGKQVGTKAHQLIKETPGAAKRALAATGRELAKVDIPAVVVREVVTTNGDKVKTLGMESRKLGDVVGGGTGAKGIDNASVTNKSNLYRGDSLLHSPTRPNGIGKPHISSSGDLVPASKDGLYKGRQVTVTEHILGGYRKGAKSNSPYTSFTNNKNVIGNYGENSIELDISALRKDIQSGKVKDVVILSPKQIKKLIERDVISSDFWKNRAINWTKRDNEYLIKGEVPSQYIKVSSKE